MTYMSRKTNRHPADQIHEGLKALKGVGDLLASIPEGSGTLHLVEPEHLGYMLKLIEERLAEGLEAMDPQEQRFG